MIVGKCLCVLQDIVWLIAKSPPDERMVIVAKDALSLGYALNFIEWAVPLKIPAVVSIPKKLQRYLTENQKNLVILGRYKFLFIRWRLAVFPSHGFAPYLNPLIPKLWVGHGIEGGRTLFGGYPYTYGWKSLSGFSEPSYDFMLASSLSELKMCTADRYGKKVLSRLFLGVEPAADKLLKHAGQQIPKSDRQNIFITSTWVKGCLADQLGNRIFSVHQELSKDFNVFWSFHQRLVDRSGFAKTMSGLTEMGANICPPIPQAWLKVLVLCQIMIGDVTSLALYFAILGRPVLFSSSARAAHLAPHSSLKELIEISSSIQFDVSLRPQIAAAQTDQSLDLIECFRNKHYGHMKNSKKLAQIVTDLYSKGIVQQNKREKMCTYQSV